MDTNNINRLLEKYWEGESTLQEEATLQEYFNNGNVATEHEEFQSLFQFYADEKEITISDDFEKRLLEKIQNEPQVKIRKINWMRTIRSVAAVGILLVGAFFVFQNISDPVPPEYKGRKAKVIALVDEGDTEEAMEATKAALELISRKMKKGAEKANEGIVGIKAVNKNPLKK